MYEMQVRVDEAGMLQEDWRSLKPRWPVGVPPYRYEDPKQAQEMLDRLFPTINPLHKRIKSV